MRVFKKIKRIVPKLIGRGKKTCHPELKHVYQSIRAKRDICLAEKEAVESIFLGSSHVDYGFFPEYFSGRAYNLGSNSQDLYTSYKLYSFFSSHLPNLKNVFLGVSVFSMGYELAKTSRNFICDSFHALLCIEYNDYEYGKENLKACEKLKGCSSYSNCNGFLFPSPIPHDLTSLEERVAGHLRENKRLPSQLGNIAKIVELTRKNNQRVHFILMPARKDYVDALPPKLELFDAFYSVVAMTGSPSIIDFYGKEIFMDEDFYDFDHLNLKGAKKLSKQLKGFVHD